MKSFKLLALTIITALLPLYVIWNNVFPSFRYFLKKADNYGIKILEKKYGSQQYLVVPVFSNYPFDKIKLFLQKELAGAEQYHIEVARDYAANSYPIGQAIRNEEELKELIFFNNSSGLANGTLFSYGPSVYFISKGQYLSILSPQVFEGLGFRWDNVMPLESDIFQKLTPGEKLNYSSFHPDGTILKTKEGELYLVWEEKRLPIPNEEWLDHLGSYYWVNVQGAAPEYFADCRMNFSGKGKGNCIFNADQKKYSLLGNSYLFRISPTREAAFVDAQVRLKTAASFEKSFLVYSLGQIKNKLYLRYAGHFF